SNSISDKIQLSAKPFENESIARSKDGIGEFILLSPEKVSFNAPNKSPGSWIKHANSTTFSPRDSSPNACLLHNDSMWIFSGYRFNGHDWPSESDVYKSGNGVFWELVNENPPYDPYSG